MEPGKGRCASGIGDSPRNLVSRINGVAKSILNQ
jgi:hypothetical protein